jgi:hypothetical protein
VDEIKRKQGLADVRFHDLCHEAVSRFVEACLSDQEASAISGHKSSHLKSEGAGTENCGGALSKGNNRQKVPPEPAATKRK